MEVTVGKLGGIAQTAAEPLLQVGQFGSHVGELAAEFIVLLPEKLHLLVLREDQRSDGGSC